MLEYFQKLNSSFAEIETCQCRKYSFQSELRPPPWFFRVWSTVTTVPLYKTCKREEDKLRPLGVAPTMVRLLDKFAAVQYRQVLQGYLEPQQLALSPAGGHKLVYIVRMVMEAHNDWMWR